MYISRTGNTAANKTRLVRYPAAKMIRQFAVVVGLGILLSIFPRTESSHVYVPLPDGIEQDVWESGRVADKHLVQRFSQWYHKRQHHGEKNCGIQDIQPISTGRLRVIGGRDAIPGSWPWMVSISFLQAPVCGGALIGDQWVLTAAHCFDVLIAGFAHFSNYAVTAGKTFLYMTGDTEQDSGIENFIKHPFYKMGTLDNDIALIKLKRRVRRSRSVAVICLPPIDPEPLESWIHLVAIGWGATSTVTDSPEGSPSLQQVSLPLIPRSVCEGYNCCRHNLTDSMFCAGYKMGGRDTCAGDSGSPLQFVDREKWYIKGVVSWGGGSRLDCAQPLTPGVYTDVFKFVPWILWEMFLYQ